MARDVTVAALLTVVGLAIVIGPWIYRLASDLTDERAERVRTQERADVAAHLHDSVLQTLALIQKNADDGATVARLARAQERDLRVVAVRRRVDRRAHASPARCAVPRPAIEDEYGVSVDVVNVGDCDLDEALRADRARDRRGGHQRRQARRHRQGRRLRRDHRRGRRRVRARPRPRLRPDERARRPVRRPQQHHRPDAAPRRLGRGPLRARRRAPRCACTWPASPDRRRTMSEQPMSQLVPWS